MYWINQRATFNWANISPLYVHKDEKEKCMVKQESGVHLHVNNIKFHRHNEKNRGFHLVSNSPLRWKNPYVIGTYTFKTT